MVKDTKVRRDAKGTRLLFVPKLDIASSLSKLIADSRYPNSLILRDA